MKGHIDEEGKSTKQPQQNKKKEKEAFTLSEEQTETIAQIIACVEAEFDLSDESQLSTVLENVILSDARDKELKNTKSWSTNCLIKLYHCHPKLKESKTFPDFIATVTASEPVQKSLAESHCRIEKSGYLTRVDTTKIDLNMTSAEHTD